MMIKNPVPTKVGMLVLETAAITVQFEPTDCRWPRSNHALTFATLERPTGAKQLGNHSFALFPGNPILRING